MNRGFWDSIKKPIIGLAPMDGVTDAPFRFITAKYGKPDLIVTEFTSSEGICHSAVKALRAFLFSEIERPITAQLFGSDPESFYHASFVLLELGFDGIDINMGCPATNVASKGAGAGLIRTPDIAKKIIRNVKQACKDFSEGKKIEATKLPQEIIDYVKNIQKNHSETKKLAEPPKLIPVSVKTRIGYDTIVIEEWIKHIIEEKPAAISLHGRTLKQMYTGSANWEKIAEGAKIAKENNIVVLGNGDVQNIEDGQQKIKDYGLDGVLIGRKAFGNPWIFKNQTPTIAEKMQVAIEHSHLHEKLFGDSLFVVIRKHLAWYCRGFDGASEIRQKLMQTKNAHEVEAILKNIK